MIGCRVSLCDLKTSFPWLEAVLQDRCNFIVGLHGEVERITDVWFDQTFCHSHFLDRRAAGLFRSFGGCCSADHSLESHGIPTKLPPIRSQTKSLLEALYSSGLAILLFTTPDTHNTQPTSSSLLFLCPQTLYPTHHLNVLVTGKI